MNLLSSSGHLDVKVFDDDDDDDDKRMSLL